MSKPVSKPVAIPAKSVSEASANIKETLRRGFAHEAARRTGEDEGVVQVKDKLRRLPAFQDMGENELSTEVEQLTDRSQLHNKFSHLYDIYEVVDRVVAEAAAPLDEFQTSFEREATRRRAEGRLERVAQLPVFLYLTDLQSVGQKGALARTAGTRLAATLTTTLDFEYGAHHAALVIGDVVLGWFKSSDATTERCPPRIPCQPSASPHSLA